MISLALINETDRLIIIMIEVEENIMENILSLKMKKKKKKKKKTASLGQPLFRFQLVSYTLHCY